jgi:alkylation response protein AidB-like acyl-CoA dehydrogenase
VYFGFTEEQLAFGSLARKVATDISSASDSEGERFEVGSDALKVLGETGLHGLLIPEDQGGSGATLIEGAMFAEELGRALAPASVASSALICPTALPLIRDVSTRNDVAKAIARGEFCSVVVGSDLTWPPRGEGFAWGWQPGAIVLEADPEGLRPARETEFAAILTQDLTLRIAPIGPLTTSTEHLVDSEVAQHFQAAVNVIASCLLLGCMRATLELAVAYANEREQFGAKIGTFQAIKHICADMLVDVESSHSIAYGAAALLTHSSEPLTAVRSAAIAKSWCGDAAVRVCESAIQVYGGIGFTWECPVHRYLRSALTLRSSFMNTTQSMDYLTKLDQWI